MAKITREPQKIFAGSLTPANNIAVFGSLAQGSPSYSGDPSTIQSAEYSLGWAGATVANQAPALQDMNALFYNDSYQLAYIMQTAIPEWDAATIYFIGSIAQDGFGGMYVSIADNNTNNALTDTTKWRRANLTSQSLAQNYSLVASVATNALTIALKDAAGATPSLVSPCLYSFRSGTATAGTYNILATSAAASIVVPSGATLGLISGNDSYIYFYAVNNAGVVEYAVSAKKFDDHSVQNVTAISGSSTSATTIYGNSSVSNAPVRLIARLKSNQVTSGTWLAVPSEISLGTDFITGGLVGDTSGLVPASGYIGQTFTFLGVDVTTSSSTPVQLINVGGLTPGTYIYTVNTSLNTLSGTVTAQIGLRDLTNNVFIAHNYMSATTSPAPITMVGILTVAANTNYQISFQTSNGTQTLQALADSSSVTGTVLGCNRAQFVRIA